MLTRHPSHSESPPFRSDLRSAPSAGTCHVHRCGRPAENTRQSPAVDSSCRLVESRLAYVHRRIHPARAVFCSCLEPALPCHPSHCPRNTTFHHFPAPRIAIPTHAEAACPPISRKLAHLPWKPRLPACSPTRLDRFRHSNLSKS